MAEPLPTCRDTEYAEHTVKSLLEGLVKTGRASVAKDIHEWLGRELTKRGRIEVVDAK